MEAVEKSAYARMLADALPKETPARNGMRLASFFCCGGGIDLGFRSAGFELSFANDIGARAVETFSKNLGHAPVHRDIRKVGAVDYPAGEIDVVTGGFPCVTFSMAGKRLGVVDDLHGKLYLELCRVIREIRPRYFVAENVEGIISANGGKAAKIVLAEFLRLGYRAQYQLVNMAEHGVPQTRKRVIFVGVRLDQWRGSFIYPPKTRRLKDDKKADKWLPPAVTLLEAIGDLPAPNEHIVGMMHGDAAEKMRRGNGVSAYHNSKSRSGHAPAQTTSANVLLFNLQPRAFCQGRKIARDGRPAPTVVAEGTSAAFVANHEKNDVPAYAFNQARSKAHGGRPAPTVSTPKQNAHFVIDGVTMRRMTVRECARVQSFPDWYEFAGSQADGYQLVGNAVPPLYAKRLAEALAEYNRREIIR